MKKLLLLSALALLVFAAGCSSGTPNDTKATSSPSGNNPITVVTSIYPMYDFTKKLAGDKVNITNLTPAGIEPHDWEPTASDIVQLEKADIFIYNGKGFEHWVDATLVSISSQKLMVVEAGKSIPDADSSGSKDGASDPHIWLNPLDAKKQMEAILQALQEADPANKDFYQANYNKYAADFDQLDQEYKNQLKDLPQRNIVVAHQAFGYLCQAYNLTQVPIEGLSADSEPDAAKMSQIIDFVKANHIKVIFFEELVSPKVAQTIADQTQATTAVLNPIEGLSEADAATGQDYFSIMRKNLAALVAALSA